MRTRSVREDDCDELGHVNNVTWVRFVIELATAHSDAVGLDWDAYRALGGAFVVHRQEVEYLAPAVPGEALREETWIVEMRGARCVRRSRFLRAVDAAVLLEARTTWVFAALASGRPRRIPAAVGERFPVAADGEVAA